MDWEAVVAEVTSQRAAGLLGLPVASGAGAGDAASSRGAGAGAEQMADFPELVVDGVESGAEQMDYELSISQGAALGGC